MNIHYFHNFKDSPECKLLGEIANKVVETMKEKATRLPPHKDIVVHLDHNKVFQLYVSYGLHVDLSIKESFDKVFGLLDGASHYTIAIEVLDLFAPELQKLKMQCEIHIHLHQQIPCIDEVIMENENYSFYQNYLLTHFF